MMKGVLFDLDGTLLDTLEDLKEGVNAAMREVGAEENTLEEVRKNVGSGVRNLIEKSLKEKTQYLEEALKANKEYYDSHLTVFTKEYPGISKLLRELKDKGYQVGVLSNKYDSATQRLLQHYFPGLIDRGYGLVEGYPKKPDATLFLKLLEEMKLRKDQVVYVGDSEVDLELAKNAGVTCILVNWGFRKIVPGKDYYCVSTTEEIMKIMESL